VLNPAKRTALKNKRGFHRYYASLFVIERLFILCEYILNEQFYKNASGAV
jgi:hypothetical protein